ncbi:sensor histidine kinase [Nonomuraea sp. CA-141351]|uniref:sensor histidine kinase n=1 Tax=Nonomuraea sp. CA-141351 TaxID=3239996 RepID=UPI003D8E8DCB
MNVGNQLAAGSGVPGRGVRVTVDAGLAVAFAGLLAFGAYRIAGTWGGGYWQFGCAAGAMVCGLALARRRGRTWAAVAGLAVAAAAVLASRYADLPAEPGPAMVLGLSVLVGSAVRALPSPAACAVAAGGLAVALGSLLTAHAALAPVTTLNLGGWLAGVAFGLGHKVLAVRRRTMADHVRRHERLQLARELHDVVAHHVTGIVLQAQAAQVLARRQPDRLGGSLSGIEEAGSDALAAMRRLVGLLRETDEAAPPALGPERLSDLVERFDGPEVRLHLPDGENEPAWPPEVTTTVYRVVRESLTNVSRHARHARTVDVTVALDRDTVTVEVCDDAPPVPARPHRRAGYGLLGMRERVEALGGTLHAGPRQGAGWSVRATLPLPARERR